jgi:hypothetical protein
MLASMCVNKREAVAITEEAMKEQTTAHKMDAEHQAIQMNEKQKQSIIKLSTLNYLLYEKLADEDLLSFLSEHPYSTLDDVFKDMQNRNNYKLCLMTFSNPMELENVRGDILEKFGINLISSEDIFALGLEKRSTMMRNYRESFIVIQFVYAEHLSMISQLKANIEQNSKVTRVLFIVHLERDPRKRDILRTNIGINYWNDWDNRVLDNIHMTRYKEFSQIRNMTFEELILN